MKTVIFNVIYIVAFSIGLHLAFGLDLPVTIGVIAGAYCIASIILQERGYSQISKRDYIMNGEERMDERINAGSVYFGTLIGSAIIAAIIYYYHL